MNTREQLAEVIRDGVDSWRTPLEAADAILKAGYRKPEVFSPEKLRIDGGYLALEVDHCTCSGYGEPYYAHENDCGLEPLTDITDALKRAGYVLETAE